MRADAGAPEPGDALDALADANRREILRLLGERERAVHELASELPISRPAVSRHLRLLMRTGFVTEERAGTRHIFRLTDAGPQAVQAYLEQLWSDASTRFRMFAENTTPRADDD
ncbi:ArsR/SmtB family transcription factor [uncultured Amnibacterium sp.]|uniref:ArsR/SmtB family transcription factor n=1 Tax=uncultured Amnibacterium sp. TaxID=1631851 RepID=UPI0035CB4FDB